MDFVGLLREYDFSEREAKIYLTCLEFGEDIPSSIARRANENRVTTYSILKDLAKKGIANEITKNGKKYYSVLTPEKLLKKEKNKFEKLQKAVPLLSAITSEYAHKPKMYFYEGIDGVKEVYKDALNTIGKEKEILTITSMGAMSEQIKVFLRDEYKPQRINSKIKSKIIYSKKDWFDIGTKQQYRDILFLDDDLLNVSSDITIYGNSKVHIVMFSGSDVSATIIDNKSLHDTLKSIFNLMWKTYRKSS